MINPINGILTDTSAIPLKAKLPTKGFMDELANKIQEIDKLDKSADQHIKNTLLGKTEDMSKAVIELQKSEIAFNFTTGLASKAVAAYREIMNLK